ncbi:short-chain dehydrogenase reductase 3b-like, partial [Momordica charantia]|uniref:Short-chain dehydrogenase reductase 3b-like n=1 Tax=Momordica charantia TaxID=3673 RepID=A0A6J1DLH0_MOMCH
SRRLHGKVALITGAASGIGEETARLFAANGAFVVVADIDDELGQQVAASIGADKASFRHCNVRDEKQVEETVSYTVEKHGRLDILFSNAAVMDSFTSILEFDMAEFDNVMTTNVSGVIATIKHAGRAMVEQNIRGSIICTASVVAMIGGIGPVAYASSKHAVVGVMRSSCAELGTYGIRVNCVSPHGVATPMACRSLNLKGSEVEELVCSRANLKGVVLKASHMAEAALFLASDESACVSGQNLVVDGGYSVVKSFMNGVSPYGVATPMTCNSYNMTVREAEDSSAALANLKGIVLKPRHVAEAVLFLASDESAYVSGHDLAVDGGFTVVRHPAPAP